MPPVCSQGPLIDFRRLLVLEVNSGPMANSCRQGHAGLSQVPAATVSNREMSDMKTDVFGVPGTPPRSGEGWQRSIGSAVEP